MDQKIKLLFAAALIIVVSITFFRLVQKGNSIFNLPLSEDAVSQVEIRKQTVKVTVAISDNDKSRGLSGKSSLADNEGMLFLYDTPGTPSFWMKDMKFPIDIIWIKGDSIADISANVPVSKSTPLPTYKPKAEIDKVLEVKAGWTELNKVKVGDKVKFKK